MSVSDFYSSLEREYVAHETWGNGLILFDSDAHIVFSFCHSYVRSALSEKLFAGVLSLPQMKIDAAITQALLVRDLLGKLPTHDVLVRVEEIFIGVLPEDEQVEMKRIICDISL